MVGSEHLDESRLSAVTLTQIERQVMRAQGSRTGVLVVSDDAIIQAGLRAVLSETGVLCWAEGLDGLEPSTATTWDYVLVWIASPRGIDPFGAIPRVAALGERVTTQVPIIAVYSGALSPFVRLRIAEAGLRYVLPHAWLSSNLNRLSQLLESAEVPTRFHLETPLALRQKLELGLAGDLERLLEAALELPHQVWTGHLPQSHLPISRAHVQQLRQLALDVAGIPAPDFSKYATSLRTPPSTPEWHRVREVVRHAFNIST
ncbi:hypothetical protein ACFOYW_18390 [Gryllotalpicola reticulitermitis]|uniref:Response regulatory domain-containing protein n=1 Tax=Gryllotalpicola reticulitermitis TaxID=1184153 RepID=A0ABV8QBL2_9MICO